MGKKTRISKVALVTQVRKEVPQNSGDMVYSSQPANMKVRGLQVNKQGRVCIFFFFLLNIICFVGSVFFLG